VPGLGAAADTPPTFDAPKDCWACEEWNEPHEPFQIHGNTFYVGVAGLSTLAVTTSAGVVLFDAGLPQSAEIISANLAKLGHQISEVVFIATSHEHYDHVGGVAALQRASGATVLASAPAAKALAAGLPLPEDPQIDFGVAANSFPPIRGPLRIVADGERIRVGEVELVAHTTPGHTPGSLTWSWRSCNGDDCRTIVYADSLNPVSADDFRFSDSPERVAAFRASIERVRTLPCDIVVSVHPGFTDLFGKLAKATSGDAGAFAEAGGCRAYADDAERRLEERLATEATSAGAP
jgi:metallo-beta-lactamase class B